MGVFKSKFLDQEKTSWVKSHELECEPHLANVFRKLVSNFKDSCDLHLCYENKTNFGYPYEHWFVTDGIWTIEFGSGDILNIMVVVHPLKRRGYIIADTFKMNNDIRNRMLQVSGASNYSLALRNCEHVARYIQSGMWVSFQMAKDTGPLFKIFKNHLSSHSKLVNTFPKELEPMTHRRKEIYKDYKNLLEFTRTKNILTEADNDSYNVLFIGPTGCGKSTLINNLFNLTVVNAAASAESVTRKVEFIEGTTIMRTTESNWLKSLNIIDTLGFCDSVFTEDEIMSIIKSSLELNLAKIDKVLIVCSGRIEHHHAEAIKQFMKWLQYDKNKKRFCFIYNKSDMLTEGEKVTCLLKMCEMLGADTTDDAVIWMEGDQKRVFKQNLNLGFPPMAEFKQIETDMNKLTRAATFAHETRHPRIHLEKSMCSIL